MVRHFLVRPLRPWRRARDLVRTVEQQGDFANVLVSAEEAERLPDRWAGSHPVRVELRRRMYRRAEGILDGLTGQQVLTLPQARAWGLGLVAVVCSGPSFCLFPVRVILGEGLTRLAKPWPAKVLVPEGGLYGLPDQDFVIAGEDIDLAALDFAGGPDAGRSVKSASAAAGGSGWRPGPSRSTARRRDCLRRTGSGPPLFRRCARILPGVSGAGAMVTEVGQVSVIHHPLVTGLSARVIPPAYTRLPPRDLARLPAWFEVPAGSMVAADRDGEPSRRQRAWLVTAGKDTLALEVDSVRISGDLRVDRVDSLHREPGRRFRPAQPVPLQYEVAAAEDAVPAVRLERPDDDGILPLSGEVTLEVEAADDFGLAGLDLLVRAEGRRQGPAQAADPEDWHGGRIWPGLAGAAG